jgi:hypothetical protein
MPPPGISPSDIPRCLSLSLSQPQSPPLPSPPANLRHLRTTRPDDPDPVKQHQQPIRVWPLLCLPLAWPSPVMKNTSPRQSFSSGHASVYRSSVPRGALLCWWCWSCWYGVLVFAFFDRAIYFLPLPPPTSPFPSSSSASASASASSPSSLDSNSPFDHERTHSFSLAALLAHSSSYSPPRAL